MNGDANITTNAVIKCAKDLGAETFIKAQDIMDGNKKLNLSFVAQLFNLCPNLQLPEVVTLTGFENITMDDDQNDSREERVFRMWINSLNLDDVYVHDLFGDLFDGKILLKVIDTVEPGIVIWKKVNMNTKLKIKLVENCNYAVSLCKDQLKFSLVGIGGIDVVNGNKKLILAIVWQLLRRYTLKMIANLASKQGIKEVAEEHIVDWANKTVSYLINLIH